MIKKNKILIICFTLILIYLIKNFIIESMIVGTYVSNNKSSLADGPGYGDTLKIYNNSNFESQTWGKGKYKLKYSVSGTEIELEYKYEFGNAGYTMSINRSFLGKPQMIIVRDLEYYFEKCK